MIKHFIFRLIVLMLILSGITSYIASLNGIDVRQFLPKFDWPLLPNLKLPAIPEIKLPIGSDQDIFPATISKVYKWRGADGIWHFSEELPEGITPAQTIFLNADTNLIQGLPQPSEVDTSDLPANATSPAQQQTQPISLNPYNKKAIDKLLNDAKGVQKIFDKHALELEQASQVE